MRTALAAVCSLLLGGCVLSLEPFYSADSTVASPVAAGKWRRLERDGKPETAEIWEFTADRISVYDDRGQWRTLEAKYFRVGSLLFVDTFPRERSREAPSEAYWLLHFAPFHMVSRFEVSAERVVARPLAATKEALDALRSSALRVAGGQHRSIAAEATPAQWKAFLEKHGKDDGVFPEAGQLVFVPAKD